MFKNIFLASVAAAFLSIDQAIKFFLMHSLIPGESIPVIKNVFYVTLVFNTGCAFGLCKSQPNLFFIVSTMAAIIALACLLIRLKSKDEFYRLAAVLLIAGSLSNLIDRLRFGYVIDFLDFRIWPVFNLADTAISIGVFILIVQLVFKSPAETTVKDRG